MVATKEKLIEIAQKEALFPYHGFILGDDSNIKLIIDLFPKWNIIDADCSWCAAFVYYCLRMSGYKIPYSPNECITCSLVGCGGFEEFALNNKRIEYFKFSETNPEIGDIVIFDNVFSNEEHDHMGIIIDKNEEYIFTAEGNIPGRNSSGIVKRKIDNHIRCYIRIPDAFVY